MSAKGMRLVGGPADGMEHPDGPYDTLAVPAYRSQDDIDWDTVTFTFDEYGLSTMRTADGKPVEWIEQHEYVRDGDVWRYSGLRG